MSKDLNELNEAKKESTKGRAKKEPATKKAQEEKPVLDPFIPRGERADFLKITLTIPSNLLMELRALGMRRKANKQKDTDTSSLIREALAEFLNKQKNQ
jgi:hypothetical protein